MPTRFDHAVIGVRDLDSALEQYRHLGFDAQPGGRHADGGTHNGLIRFGLDYIELLAVYDEEAARARGRSVLDELRNKQAVLTGYALATTSIEEEAKHFRGTQAELPQPRVMGRKRPNGQALTWRVLAPGGISWGCAWPFLIQWDIPDEERLSIDVPGTHANGVIAWRRVDVAVNDLETARDIYQTQLGLELVKEDTCPVRTARRATFAVGDATIEVLAPEGEGLISQVLAEKGEGPYALYLTVKKLEQAQAFFEKRKIGFIHEAVGAGRLLLDPDETLGVQIYLTE